MCIYIYIYIYMDGQFSISFEVHNIVYTAALE